MILLLDNYDSFTWNLYQYLSELGAEVIVRRNDEISVAGVEALRPSGIVISPGPCAPAQAGVSNELIRAFGGRLPILGVCLGHQCIAEVYGGSVTRAPEPVHGKTSRVYHRGAGLLDGLPRPFEAIRYHSLIVERATLPPELEITAETADGLIMGLRHRDLPVHGVQFHPESIMTPVGKQLLANFLALSVRGERKGEASGAVPLRA